MVFRFIRAEPDRRTEFHFARVQLAEIEQCLAGVVVGVVTIAVDAQRLLALEERFHVSTFRQQRQPE